MQQQRWEYRTIVIDVAGWLGPKVSGEELDASLNAQGAEGWELVSCFDVNHHQGSTSAVVAMFKRARN